MRIAIANLESNPSFVEKMEQADEAKQAFIEKRKLCRLATLPEILTLCVAEIIKPTDLVEVSKSEPAASVEVPQPELSQSELQAKVEELFPKGSEARRALDEASFCATVELCGEFSMSAILEGDDVFKLRVAKKYIEATRRELDQDHLEAFDKVQDAVVQLTAMNFVDSDMLKLLLNQAHSIRLSAMVGTQYPDIKGQDATQVGECIMGLSLLVKETIKTADDLIKEIEAAGLGVPDCLLPKKEPVVKSATPELTVTVTTPEPDHLQVTMETTIKGEPLPFPVQKKTLAERLVEVNNLRKKGHKSNK